MPSIIVKLSIAAMIGSSLFSQIQAYNNRDYISKLNQNSQNGVSYQENGFINHTQAEFDQFYKGLNSASPYRETNCATFVVSPSDYSSPPESWDWRKNGVVTTVKNQGKCGSCWSFSAAGALEGAWAISTGQLFNFSEQQLMDCSRRYGNMACNGGLMDKAFEYAIDNGMCKLEDVPYDAQSEFCTQTVKNCKKVAQFNNCFKIPANNERLLREAVYRSPVAVSIEADTKTFQFYKGGILDSTNCGTELDHGVLAVGYGEEDGKKYWIVKNSWGSDWGENGYVRIGRSDDEDSEGVCGIAKDASFVMV
jgi:C1A family cysteine protease